MIELIYRGVNYQSLAAEATSPSLVKKGSKHHRAIRILPIYCYTYRGVSYTKKFAFNKSNFLLDIDRQ